jgi:hypothetical protein
VTTLAQRHHAELTTARGRVSTLLSQLPPLTGTTFVYRLVYEHLTTLIADIDIALSGVCPETPESLIGTPIGQYHCPQCGCMTLAGMAHWHDDGCWFGLNDADTPGTDGPRP